MKKILSKSYDDTIKIAEEFAKQLGANAIVLLIGDLGAGKTCFVNGVLQGLNFKGGGASPTFTIVNEYPSQTPVNHFDLYRIKSEDELFDLGFIEYLESGKINIIEWPQIAENILKDYQTITVEITQTDLENEREVLIYE